MKTVNCSFCGKELEILHEKGADLPDLVYTMIGDGGVNWFGLGYGSGYDMRELMLAICDGCLDKCKPVAWREYGPNGPYPIILGHPDEFYKKCKEASCTCGKNKEECLILTTSTTKEK